MTGSLQEKGGIYQCVLNFKDRDGKKQKWISTGLPVKGNKRKAEKILNDILSKHAGFDNSIKSSSIKFTDYSKKWFENKKGTVEQCTWDGYYNSVEKHIIPYFSKLNLDVQSIKS